MSSPEEDPYTPAPNWIDWVLSEITIVNIVDVTRGSRTRRVAVTLAEVLASQSANATVGDIARNVFHLGPSLLPFHLEDDLRNYACLDMDPLPQAGDRYLVATYFQDSDDGMRRSAVTAQWEI